MKMGAVNGNNAETLENPLEENTLDPQEAQVFCHWLSLMNENDIPYAVSGAFAIHAYTGIMRNTKDLDIYIKPADLKKALVVLENAGYRTEIRDRAWLAKVHSEDIFMDLLFAVHRQRFRIEDNWFQHRRRAKILDVEAHVLAPEELFVSKAHLVKTYRFDGADLMHLIRSLEGRLDWHRILDYLDDERDLLLWYLLLFQFVYPGHIDYLPTGLMEDLFTKIRQDWKSRPAKDAFRGALLDPDGFAMDVKNWGYIDYGKDLPLVSEKGDLL